LDALSELAPLHQSPALGALRQCRATWPQVPNVACFDTAFHATIPEAARTYALASPYREQVRVYGFHGLSHAWAARRVDDVVPGVSRVVVAHLGGGQSLCGVLDGRSVVTTMGFTPVDGLVMATRVGSIDPGAILWLAEHHPDVDLASVLETQSGLLGLAGTADMRVVQERALGGDAAAVLAFDVWRHRAVTLAAGCIAAVGGLDALVFTGGIGEHDVIARRAITTGLAFVGVAVDDPGTSPDDIDETTARGSSARVFVVRAREDLQLAAEAIALASR
jgi:acetate kinase